MAGSPPSSSPGSDRPSSGLMEEIPVRYRMVLPALILTMLPPDPLVRADGPPAATRDPLHRVVDLDVGESRQIELRGGSRAEVKLLALEESRDPVRDAVR